MTQWIPHGQLVVPDIPPEADSRMANCPGLNEGGHTGYHEFRRQAEAWPTTEATPDGPAGMLSTGRDLYAQSYYAYALMAVGCTWSVFAVEGSPADQARSRSEEAVQQAGQTDRAAGPVPSARLGLRTARRPPRVPQPGPPRQPPRGAAAGLRPERHRRRRLGSRRALPRRRRPAASTT